MSDIVPSDQGRGNSLEAIKASELLRLPESHLEAGSPLYLATDLHLSDYGVRGFVLVDTKPENRRSGYYASEFYDSGESMSGYETPDNMSGTLEDADPIQTARWYGTRHGFKTVRFFVLPEAVTEFFASDKFLGDPMVKKCLEESTTPTEYREQPVRPTDIFYGDDAIRGDEMTVLRKQKVAALGNLLPLVDPSCSPESFKKNDGDWDDYPAFGSRNQKAYISFHPWAVYQEVLTVLDESVQQGLRNMDEVLARFDNTGNGRVAAAQEWQLENNPLRAHTIRAIGIVTAKEIEAS